MKRALFSLFITLLTTGCGSSSGSSDEANPELLRVIHAATGFDTLTVSVSQSSAASSSSSSAARFDEEKEDPALVSTEYGDIFDYFAIPEGTVTVRIKEEDTVLPILELSPSVESGSAQTLLLTEADHALTGTFISDTLSKPAEGQANIRVINAVGSTLDAYIGFPDADSDDASALGTAVALAGASTYVGVDSGQYVVYFTPTGSHTIVAETEATDFGAGARYSVLATEKSSGGKPFQARVLRDR